MRRFLGILVLASCAERATATATTATATASATTATATATATATEPAHVLPIPARAQASGAPAAGWCGETAIQEGLLHLGVWAPQRLVNRAGHPTHADLWSQDVPVALTSLGVRYDTYVPRTRGFDAFARWIRAAIDEGDPVLAGVKILPTEHPEWGLDHFVLVVGYGERGLLVNTTWGHRAWVSDTSTKGLSFSGASYGMRLRGVRLPEGESRARVELLDESEETVRVRVTCERDEGERSVAADSVARFACRDGRVAL